MTYVTVTTEVDVDVDITEFDTEDLVEELERRGRPASFNDHETLTKAWLADREGRKEEAYVLLREYMLDKLNKVV
jgi:hypothetical protein